MTERRLRLAERRRTVGLSQEQLAAVMGVDRSTVVRWERRDCDPQPWHRPRLAEALKISVEQLADLLTDAGQAPTRHDQRHDAVPEHPSNIDTATQANTDKHVRRGQLVARANAGKVQVFGDVSHAVKRRRFLAAGGAAVVGNALSASSRITQALDIVTADGADSLGVAADSLDDLVTHYSERLSISPPANMYDDLLNIRAYAGALSRRQGSLPRRSDILVAAGWLSNLLAVATSYMGDHGAAIVWCGDAERRSHESGLPELAGWASLTRATIAYYQGQASRSIRLSSRGQELVPIGSAAHAKLAAQEMRARAMLGDADGMIRAKRYAAYAIAHIPSGFSTTGVFSIAMSKEDPPYTATSLLLVKRFQEASKVTKNVIETSYSSVTNNGSEPSSNYARALLILGLAEAGLGHASEAVSAGRLALSSASLVWPTLVLAAKLDRVLMRNLRNSAQAAEYHALYLDAIGRPSSVNDRQSLPTPESRAPID